MFVALSIDGSKRSGNFVCDLPIPSGLFEREVSVNVGRSMLRRFQMKGESLEGEQVADRLPESTEGLGTLDWGHGFGTVMPPQTDRRMFDDHGLLAGHPRPPGPATDHLPELVASALAGGDCIGDALRAGGTVGVLGCVVKAPSTLGTFLRSFRSVRQLDRVSRHGPLAAFSRPTGQGSISTGNVLASTGEVLMSRLREGRANTARGAAHFLRTVGRVRYGGARGQLTVRAEAASTPTLSLPPAGNGCPLLYHHPPAR